MSPESFRRELEYLMPNGDLRLSRDPRRIGFDLWVVERRIPRSEFVRGLEELQKAGEPRFIDQHIPGMGWRYYDRCPEWALVHVCENASFSRDDRRAYREPDMRDVKALRDWLFEFRDFEHSRVELSRESRERREAVARTERSGIAKDIRSSKKFRGLTYSFPEDGSGSTTERVS